MATIRILLGIICLAAFGWCGLFGSSAVESRYSLARSSKKVVQEKPTRFFVKNSAPFAVNSSIISIALSQLSVREATGKNDGLDVEEYLRYTGNQKGNPWCAAFVSWVYGQAGLTAPKTAWSPALFPKNKQTVAVKPATIFGIYFPDLGRIAHCGLVEKTSGDWIYTIEGNTNVVGSREGDGVYRKIRHHRNIAVYADWISTIKKGTVP